MKLSLFFRLFVSTFALALLAFALNAHADLLFLLKAIALGTAVSIIVALIYPEMRGVRQGDTVSVVISNSIPSFIGRVGKALSNAKKNSELRVRFDNGEEAVGIVESYSGIISPPKVRIIYEEKIIE